MPMRYTPFLVNFVERTILAQNPASPPNEAVALNNAEVMVRLPQERVRPDQCRRRPPQGRKLKSQTKVAHMAKVAFLGLGVMGFPMAGHLVKKGGHEVTVYNRTEAKAKQWTEKFGGKSAPTPKAAA